MSFTQRTTKPENNKYYIRTQQGGYNGAILGRPLDLTANVLANCVGYANGRFAEIQNLGYIKYQLVCYAEDFITKAKAYGLTVTKTPTLGGIMVWRKGKAGDHKDGAGHVAVNENIVDYNTIFTSESGYKASRPFWTKTRHNTNTRWGQSPEYTYIGCIANPGVSVYDRKGIKYMFEVKTVYKGCKGKNVKLCQKLLVAGGYKGKDGKALEIDGSCGANTVYAINSFQSAMRAKGIECGTDGKDDGICGSACWAALLDV